MKNALAIFRKDVRHLWPRIAVVLAVELVIGWTSFAPPSGFEGVRYQLGLVEELSWWYLIACVIHEEAIPGDRQYWLTRPFSRRDLLASKLIFILAFTCLPLFLAQVASLLLRGTSPLAYLPDILVSQLLFVATTVLPAAALASISAGLVEFAGTALAAWLWSYVLTMMVGSVGLPFRADYNWGGLYWFRSTLVAALMLAAGAAILLLQYLRHRTWISRGIVAATLTLTAFLAYMPGWHTAFALQAKFSDQQVPATTARITFDPTRDPRILMVSEAFRMKLGQEVPGQRIVPIPVRITGIPAGMAVYSDRTSVTLITPNGDFWTSDWDPRGALIRPVGTGQNQVLAEAVQWVLAGDGGDWLCLLVDRSFYGRIRSGPLHLHAKVALTLLSPQQITPLALRDGYRLRGPRKGAESAVAPGDPRARTVLLVRRTRRGSDQLLRPVPHLGWTLAVGQPVAQR